MKIKDVMNKAIAIDHDVSIREAAKIMSGRNIGSLIVLKSNKIVGIITERDVLKNVNSLGRKISGAMTKLVVTIDHKDTIDNAALIMTQKQIKRLPVLDNDKLVGIITATDIIANSDILNEDFFFD